jgi:RNA polymerase-binding transcription factor DksA
MFDEFTTFVQREFFRPPMSKKPVKNRKPGATAKKGAPPMSANVAAILGLGGASPKGKSRSKTSIVANGAAKVKPEWVKYHNILMELRERLRNQMAGLAKESAEQLAGYSLHMADSGTDNFDRDFALSLLSSDQDAVYEIEEALKRIEKRTYGVCELTGKSIPKARLDAIPWTRFTVEAQMQLEKEGALRSRRLGSLGSVDSVGGIELDDDDHDDKPAKESKD